MEKTLLNRLADEIQDYCKQNNIRISRADCNKIVNRLMPILEQNNEEVSTNIEVFYFDNKM